MNALKIISTARRDLEHGNISVGEYEKIVNPFRDAAPVRRGRWMPIIEVNEFGEPYQSGVHCSECGDTECYEPNFCPNCGANMEVEHEGG